MKVSKTRQLAQAMFNVGARIRVLKPCALGVVRARRRGSVVAVDGNYITILLDEDPLPLIMSHGAALKKLRPAPVPNP